MRSKLRPSLALTLPLLTIGVFFVLLTFSLIRLSLTQHNMRLESPHNNLLWIITQAQTATQRLTNTVGRTAMGIGASDALERQHQVFLSRIVLMDEGPQRRQLEAPGYAQPLQDFQRTLPALVGLLDQLEPGRFDLAADVDEQLTPLRETLTQAATQAMVSEWDSMGAKLEVCLCPVGVVTVSD